MARTSRSYARLKRAMDIAIAASALVLVGPLLILCCLAVKIVSPGPALVRIKRVGIHGRPFHMLKVRTMAVNSEEWLKAYLQSCPEAAAEWARGFKLKKDPRIIPGVGSFLRRTSIDELPQLLNVLKGSMTIVGPRPFPDYHLASFTPEFRELRQSVVPGVTGLWQVMRGSASNLPEQERFDRLYIRKRSLAFDLYVLARTFGAVRKGIGSY
jgi:lipopolysaccharide/colanic/teichoic acid biosynthesis glycosyltransferase